MSALNTQINGTHYKELAIQPVEFIHANQIPYMEGNVIKYVTRWRSKGGVADLHKAKHYIELLIELEEKQAAPSVANNASAFLPWAEGVSTMRLENLAEAWMQAKETERAAIERRRDIEDQLRALANIRDDAEGVQSLDCGAWRMKITCRLDRKVDSDLLQEIAAEHGLSEHLSTLFRWKPEVNMKLWDAAAPQITSALAGAITVKPGRPSFAIQPKE